VRRKAAFAGGAGDPAERGRIGSAEGRTRAAGAAKVFTDGAEFELDASPASIFILGWGGHIRGGRRILLLAAGGRHWHVENCIWGVPHMRKRTQEKKCCQQHNSPPMLKTLHHDDTQVSVGSSCDGGAANRSALARATARTLLSCLACQSAPDSDLVDCLHLTHREQANSL
jgi:hypothetical protein